MLLTSCSTMTRLLPLLAVALVLSGATAQPTHDEDAVSPRTIVPTTESDVSGGMNNVFHEPPVPAIFDHLVRQSGENTALPGMHYLQPRSARATQTFVRNIQGLPRAIAHASLRHGPTTWPPANWPLSSVETSAAGPSLQPSIPRGEVVIPLSVATTPSGDMDTLYQRLNEDCVNVPGFVEMIPRLLNEAPTAHWSPELIRCHEALTRLLGDKSRPVSARPSLNSAPSSRQATPRSAPLSRPTRRPAPSSRQPTPRSAPLSRPTRRPAPSSRQPTPHSAPLSRPTRRSPPARQAPARRASPSRHHGRRSRPDTARRSPSLEPFPAYVDPFVPVDPPRRSRAMRPGTSAVRSHQRSPPRMHAPITRRADRIALPNQPNRLAPLQRQEALVPFQFGEPNEGAVEVAGLLFEPSDELMATYNELATRTRVSMLASQQVPRLSLQPEWPVRSVPKDILPSFNAEERHRHMLSLSV